MPNWSAILRFIVAGGALLLLAACAPSDGNGILISSTSADASAPIPDFDVPSGADLQSIALLHIGASSLEGLVSRSEVIVTAHAVELVRVEGIVPGPKEQPPDTPEFKKVPSHTVAETTFRLQVDQSFKGDLRPREEFLIAETGRLEAPLMRANVQYLLFLVSIPEVPGRYTVFVGEAHGRYVVAQDGVIELSVPNLDGPRAGYGYQEQFVGKRLRDVEDLFRK